MWIGWLTTALAGPEPRLEDLAFMTGTWTCEVWGGTFEETWLAPRDGAMAGVGRHRAEGRTGMMEFMAIERAEDGSITLYVAQGRPSRGTKPAEAFRLESADGRTAVFARTGEDFPQRIRYEVRAGGMLCVISGVQRGEPAEVRFEFRPSPGPAGGAGARL